MGDLVRINKPGEKDTANNLTEQVIISNADRQPEETRSKAVVPTIDIYSARVFLKISQKMFEDTLDSRISLLEKRIGERDREIMRSIRRIQSRMLLQQNKVQLPWWRKLFKKEK